MIRIQGLVKRYGSQTVLDHISLDLPEGSVTALVGPNGCGKTTLGHVLLGLVLPDAGHVTGLQGVRLAAVFQDDRLCPQLTAAANVGLVLPHEVDPGYIAHELASVGLDEVALAKPVRVLSGGQRRRVALVRGLLPPAGFVLLDEPFSGVDAESRAGLRSWVVERLAGRTALLITHDEADAQALDARVVRLG